MWKWCTSGRDVAVQSFSLFFRHSSLTAGSGLASRRVPEKNNYCSEVLGWLGIVQDAMPVNAHNERFILLGLICQKRIQMRLPYVSLQCGCLICLDMIGTKIRHIIYVRDLD